ncbi:glyoxal oxidase [Crucibulum laeve]|uniref:Glyoxal oxidase n=1 Tax=Crucibulum laeve TaxID=68775 RepID=A0A5C3MFU4_9AGAR|nr:glyoxal oxidase [Crucibulum laeve]
MQALFHPVATLCLAITLSKLANAQSTLSPPGQPARTGAPIGTFQEIGSSLVSGQQLFVGTADKVYFVDKVEGNPTQINGHSAWSSEWALGSNQQRAMNAITNSFCAGGSVLGNGTWINVGGNQGVIVGGDVAPNQDGGGTYDDPDGRRSIRLLTPCDDGNCDWLLSPYQSDQRWYPTLETLEDGTIIILGGCRNGGYVNDAGQDNPTYEFFPPRGPSVPSPVLQRTLPANLYPLTWLLPSGKLLIQSNWATVLLDYKNNQETELDNIPDAVRVYPASAGTIMLPLTPANNYTATILFCGGSNIQPNRWTSPSFIVPTYAASTSCVRLTPDNSRSYVRDDALPEARVMANLIALPNGKIFTLNGAGMGTAGYGDNDWAIGHSYADDPILMPAMYDPDAPTGKRWSRDGLNASTIPRMYHSSATLLADGSIFVTGSNPNPDYTVGPNVRYPTEYRTELFFPSYFNERRPEPRGLLSQLSYGGPSFDVVLNSDDLFGDIKNIESASVVVIRTGFSTHSMNMGQRFVQLQTSYTGYQENNTAILHVGQLPPNPAVLAPGPALIFVVVNGVPSIGQLIMVGSGTLGAQNTLAVADLPSPSIVEPQKQSGSGSNTKDNNSGIRTDSASWLWAIAMIAITLVFGL